MSADQQRSQQEINEKINQLYEKAETLLYEKSLKTSSSRSAQLKKVLDTCEEALQVGGDVITDWFPIYFWQLQAKCHRELDVGSTRSIELNRNIVKHLENAKAAKQIVIVDWRFNLTRALVSAFEKNKRRTDELFEARSLLQKNINAHTDGDSHRRSLLSMSYALVLLSQYDQTTQEDRITLLSQAQDFSRKGIDQVATTLRQCEANGSSKAAARNAELLLEARTNLARIYHRQGNFSDAEKLFNEIQADLETSDAKNASALSSIAKRYLASYYEKTFRSASPSLSPSSSPRVKHTSPVRRSASVAGKSANGGRDRGNSPQPERSPARQQDSSPVPKQKPLEQTQQLQKDATTPRAKSSDVASRKPMPIELSPRSGATEVKPNQKMVIPPASQPVSAAKTDQAGLSSSEGSAETSRSTRTAHPAAMASPSVGTAVAPSTASRASNSDKSQSKQLAVVHNDDGRERRRSSFDANTSNAISCSETASIEAVKSDTPKWPKHSKLSTPDFKGSREHQMSNLTGQEASHSRDRASSQPAVTGDTPAFAKSKFNWPPPAPSTTLSVQPSPATSKSSAQAILKSTAPDGVIDKRKEGVQDKQSSTPSGNKAVQTKPITKPVFDVVIHASPDTPADTPTARTSRGRAVSESASAKTRPRSEDTRLRPSGTSETNGTTPVLSSTTYLENKHDEALGELYSGDDRQRREQQWAKEWLLKIRRYTHTTLLEYHDNTKRYKHNVKILLIDSGYNQHRLDILKVKNQFKGFKDCINLDNTVPCDNHPKEHGSNCASLLARTAPRAHIYVASIVEKGKDTPLVHGMLEALDWALTLDVDVISISCGFNSATHELKQKLRIVQAMGKLIIVAIPNIKGDVKYNDIFPSFDHSVLSINARRSTWAVDMRPWSEGDLYFPGESVPILGNDNKPIADIEALDGTSYATPLAAGTMALILDLFLQLKPQQGRTSVEYRSLLEPRLAGLALREMSEKSPEHATARNVMPWLVLGGEEPPKFDNDLDPLVHSRKTFAAWTIWSCIRRGPR